MNAFLSLESVPMALNATELVTVFTYRMEGTTVGVKLAGLETARIAEETVISMDGRTMILGVRVEGAER